MLWTKIISLDEKITANLRLNESHKSIKLIAIFFAHSGDSWFILLALFLVWLFAKGHWHQLTALMAAGSIALAVVVLIVKFSIRRRRPEGTWGAIYRNTDPHSFPSGHAARTMMLSVLALLAGPLWFGLVLLIWAPMVSLARVAMGVHYLSDVAVGIVLGIAAGFGIWAIAPALLSWLPFLF